MSSPRSANSPGFREGTRVVLREITATLHNSPSSHPDVRRKSGENFAKTPEHEIKVRFAREFADVTSAAYSTTETLSSASSFHSLASTLSTKSSSGICADSAPGSPQKSVDNSYVNSDIPELDELIAACGNIKLNQEERDTNKTLEFADLSQDQTFASAIDETDLNVTKDVTENHDIAKNLSGPIKADDLVVALPLDRQVTETTLDSISQQYFSFNATSENQIKPTAKEVTSTFLDQTIDLPIDNETHVIPSNDNLLEVEEKEDLKPAVSTCLQETVTLPQIQVDENFIEVQYPTALPSLLDLTDTKETEPPEKKSEEELLPPTENIKLKDTTPLVTSPSKKSTEDVTELSKDTLDRFVLQLTASTSPETSQEELETTRPCEQTSVVKNEEIKNEVVPVRTSSILTEELENTALISTIKTESLETEVDLGERTNDTLSVVENSSNEGNVLNLTETLDTKTADIPDNIVSLKTIKEESPIRELNSTVLITVKSEHDLPQTDSFGNEESRNLSSTEVGDKTVLTSQDSFLKGIENFLEESTETKKLNSTFECVEKVSDKILDETISLPDETIDIKPTEIQKLDSNEKYEEFKPQQQSTTLGLSRCCDFQKLELAAQAVADDIYNKSLELSEEGDKFVSASCDLFQDPTGFDFLLTKTASSNPKRRCPDSLYVKFDPLVANSSMLPQTNNTQSINEEQNGKNEVQTPEPACTPKRNPAIAAIDRLLFYSPISTSSDGRSDEGEEKNVNQESAEEKKSEAIAPLIDVSTAKELELVRAEVVRLEEKIEKQKKGHEEELERQKQTFLEKINRLQAQLAQEIKNKDQMTLVMDEYEKSISRLIAEREGDRANFEQERTRLQEELQAANHHLNNTEAAFNDVHLKYERLKGVVSAFKSNESVLKESIQENVETIKALQNRYEQLKSHAMSQLEKANLELDTINKQHEAETVKLQALVRKAELKSNSLTELVDQKTKENKELTQILDEVIARVGNKNTE